MRVAVFANGDFIDSPLVRATLAHCDYFIAADGGARHCQTLNITPNVIIGDMDSIDPDLLTQYEINKIEIIRFPRDKNEIDLERALAFAATRGAHSISVFGGFGDRWDFTLGNLYLLAHPALRPLTIRFMHGAYEVFLVRAGVPHAVMGTRGDAISFLPLTEDAQGITLEGFYYRPHNETLALGETRGLSNALSADRGTISIARGSLLCFHTHQHPVTAPPI